MKLRVVERYTCPVLMPDKTHHILAGNSPQVPRCTRKRWLVVGQQSMVELGKPAENLGMAVVAERKGHSDDLSIDPQTVDGQSKDLGFPGTHVDWEQPQGSRQALADTHHTHNSVAKVERYLYRVRWYSGQHHSKA